MSARVVHADDPKYLKAAFSALGLSEIAGEEDEPQILAMYAACGHAEVRHDEIAWCAAYVGWALHRGGLPNTGSLLAISYAHYPGRRFTKDETVPRGAICVWPRTGGNHVNFALVDLGDTLLCIGGNQGNGRGGGVTIAKYAKDGLKVAVLPKTVAVPKGMPPKLRPEPRSGRRHEPNPEPRHAPQSTSAPKPPLEAPAPMKEKKTGVSEGATVGAGLGVLGILSQLWEAIAQAPEHLLDVMVRAAQKPQFWMFAAVIGIAVFIFWQRHQMKQEA
ncbi:MAG: hypothetical protein K2Y27_10620 [Xanthobacteraceae bacterium]|nr:hypothetical protein [Xanthobacteraceae bacterium]